MRCSKTFSLLFGLLLSVLTIACKEESSTEPKASSYLEQHIEAFAIDLDLGTVKTVELSDKAKEETSDWNSFLSAKSEIDKLQNISLQKLINNADNLIESIEKLNDSIPDPFNNLSVKSRSLVLKTQAEVLKQNLTRSDLTPELVNENGKALYLAFQNFQIQLNEVFLRKISDFEFDLDARQDSIQQAQQVKTPR